MTTSERPDWRDLPDEATDGATSDEGRAVAPRARGVLHRLPAFYRENPGAIEALAACCDDLLAQTRHGLRDLEDGAVGASPRSPDPTRESWAQAFRRAGVTERGRVRCSGTAGALVDWLARCVPGAGPPTWMFRGWDVVSLEDDLLEFRVSTLPTQVVVWSFEDLAVVPKFPDFPPSLLPAGVGVDFIRFGGIKSFHVPADKLKGPGQILSRVTIRGAP